MIDIMLVPMAVRNPLYLLANSIEEIPLFNYIYRRAALVNRESAESRKTYITEHKGNDRMLCVSHPKGSFYIQMSI